MKPDSRTNWQMRQISRAISRAKPSAASSRIKISGFVMSARPMVSICCSPQLMVLALLFTLFFKPESSVAFAARSLIATKSVALRSQLKAWG